MEIDLLCTDVRLGLNRLRPNSIQCVITSPPYWKAQREYSLMRSFDTEEKAQRWSAEQAASWNESYGNELLCYHGAVTRMPDGFYVGRVLALSVWPGNLDCKHVWKPTEDKKPGIRIEGKRTAFVCEKCGSHLRQLGHEPNYDCLGWATGKPPCGNCYVCALRGVLGGANRQTGLWRVLRKDGIVFLNVGDARLGGRGKTDCVLLPQRLALAFQADGWHVKEFLIWVKGASFTQTGWAGSVMPVRNHGWHYRRHLLKTGRSPRASKGAPAQPFTYPHSAFLDNRAPNYRAPTKECPGCAKCSKHDGYVLRKDFWRPTNSYEPVLWLTKSRSWYSDPEKIKGETSDAAALLGEPLQGNPRNVWVIPVDIVQGKDHYATFPSELVRKLIVLATPEKVCASCKAPYVRVEGTQKTLPSCDCGTKETTKPVVLDPFAGLATVGLVCSRLGRSFIGIECMPHYVEAALERIAGDAPLLTTTSI